MLALKNAALLKVIADARRMEAAGGGVSPSLRNALSLASQEVLSVLRPSPEHDIERAGTLLAESLRLLSLPVRAIPARAPVARPMVVEAKLSVEVPQQKAERPPLPPTGPTLAVAQALSSDEKYPASSSAGGTLKMSGVSLADLVAFNKKLYDLEGYPDKKEKPYTGEFQSAAMGLKLEGSLAAITLEMTTQAAAVRNKPKIVEHRRIVAGAAASLANCIVNGQLFLGGNHRTGCWSIYKVCALNSCWLKVSVIMLYGYIERLSAELAGKKPPQPWLPRKVLWKMMQGGAGPPGSDSKEPVSPTVTKPFTQALSEFLVGKIHYTPEKETVKKALAAAEKELIALPVKLPERITFFVNHPDSKDAKRFLALHWKTFKKLNDE